MSESRQTHVTLHDIDPQALDQLVQFAYTAEIVVGEGNVQVRPTIPIPTSPEISSPDLCALPPPHASPQYPVTLCSSGTLLPHPSSCPRLCSQLPAFYS
jgi:hypothetical protein